MKKLSEVKKRYNRHKTLYESTEEDLSELKQEYEDLKAEYDNIIENIDLQERSIEVMKELVESMFKESIKQYKSLIKEGLNQIFYDRIYDFDIDIGSRGSNKTATLLYRQKKEGNWSGWRDLDNGAGAVRCVVDLISRVFLITKTGRKKVVFFDESLSEISKSYTDRVLDFLKGLTENLGFKFLLITHDERYIDKVERIYEMHQGSLKRVNHE